MRNLKILAVDDSPTMRRIIINTLKRAGFRDVDEATDGKDALAKMQVDEFDFIITDWNMPEMDGLTFVNSIRAEEKYKSLPILMVTTRSVKDDIVQVMYILKQAFTVSLLALTVGLAANFIRPDGVSLFPSQSDAVFKKDKIKQILRTR